MSNVVYVLNGQTKDRGVWPTEVYSSELSANKSFRNYLKRYPTAVEDKELKEEEKEARYTRTANLSYGEWFEVTKTTVKD